MNRINSIFKDKKDILSLYVMSDFPCANDTLNLCVAAQNAGADFLEIGMPFSDPIADGPTIQRCSEVALKNGFSIESLFNQISSIRSHVSIPLILMGYINPVLQFGIEKFCQEAKRCGIDGVILPDLPVEEYLSDYQELFKKHGINNVFLITARTSLDRIKLLDDNSDAFLYLVSSEATTGGNLAISQATEEYFARISKMKLKNPAVVGFGISDHKSFKTACEYANGAIIASAFLRTLEKEGTSQEVISKFVQKIRNG
jgi:tryptophan synthase alpha chain